MTKKSHKDTVPGVVFEDGDVAFVKEDAHDERNLDANLRGDDPNAGLGMFRWFDLNDTTNQEIALWASWLTESHQTFGPDILYYRLSHEGTFKDQLYGEDQLERFGKPRRCRALFEDINEPNRFWSAFGMMSDDIFTMTITKNEYRNKIDSTGFPNVGDVVRTTWNNINYEVIYIHDHPTMAYTSSLWAFTLKRFEFSYQDGVDAQTRDRAQPDARMHSDSKDTLITDSTSAEFFGSESHYVEEESDKVIDYDDHPDLNDDLYGGF